MLVAIDELPVNLHFTHGSPLTMTRGPNFGNWAQIAQHRTAVSAKEGALRMAKKGGGSGGSKRKKKKATAAAAVSNVKPNAHGWGYVSLCFCPQSKNKKRREGNTLLFLGVDYGIYLVW